MEEPPAPPPTGSPAGAALKAKTKKSEEKGFFSLCIIAVQPHLFFATRVASSTRHCYSYSIQHLCLTGKGVAEGWRVAEGSGAFNCPTTQLKIWGIKSLSFTLTPPPPVRDNWP